uniref:Uncharacterized protein n=1 Tax=Rhizophora mucronata TaxID=61149 RepID=A0A2P2Q3L1_RHIMU
MLATSGGRRERN